jgi:signal transduction histidine kinase
VIGSETVGHETRVFVRDNGPGIAEEDREKAFGLFQRLDTDTDGSGVGLTIVRRIMEVHGGRAWVESEVGAGATFWLAFPSPDGEAVPTG